jgi:hypothetical protein
VKFILFLMFLIAPPSDIKDKDKETAKDKRVWALQSTATMEFSSITLCQEIGESIARSTKVTATINTRFYCFPKTDADLNDLITQNKTLSIAPPAAKISPKEQQQQRDQAIDKATTFAPQ